MEYPCYNCDVVRRKQGFPSCGNLREHLKHKHEPNEGQNLKAMQKRAKSTSQGQPSVIYGKLLPPLRKVTGIKNSSGQVNSVF